MIYCMVVLQKKHKFDYKISLTLFLLVIVIISAIIAYLSFYGNATSSHKRGGIALMLFMFAISIGVFKDLSLQLKEGREKIINKKLAITDLLTGLGNQNAYEMWIDEHRESFQIWVCIMRFK